MLLLGSLIDLGHVPLYINLEMHEIRKYNITKGLEN